MLGTQDPYADIIYINVWLLFTPYCKGVTFTIEWNDFYASIGYANSSIFMKADRIRITFSCACTCSL